jgi:hypothetical protein
VYTIAQLTPVALMEGMALAKTIVLNEPTKPDYWAVPSAVFSNPEIATVVRGSEAGWKDVWFWNGGGRPPVSGPASRMCACVQVGWSTARGMRVWPRWRGGGARNNDRQHWH